MSQAAVTWVCHTDSGCVPYDSIDAAKLEEAYQAKSDKPVAVVSGKYEVDVKGMQQKNVSTGYLRNVDRMMQASPPECPLSPDMPDFLRTPRTAPTPPRPRPSTHPVRRKGSVLGECQSYIFFDEMMWCSVFVTVRALNSLKEGRCTGSESSACHQLLYFLTLTLVSN